MTDAERKTEAELTARERLARLILWLCPQWTPEQRRQTVETVFGE